MDKSLFSILKKVPSEELQSGIFAEQGHLYYKINWIPQDYSNIEKSVTDGYIIIFKDKKKISEQIIQQLNEHKRKIIEKRSVPMPLQPVDNNS